MVSPSIQKDIREKNTVNQLCSTQDSEKNQLNFKYKCKSGRLIRTIATIRMDNTETDGISCRNQNQAQN